MITSQNAAQAIARLVAADVLPALNSVFIMGSMVNRDYEPTIQNAGDTVNVPIQPTLTANNIAEGGTVTQQEANLGSVPVVLNNHYEATFTISDIARVLAQPDLLREYTRPAMMAVAEQIEADIFRLAPLFTANSAVGTFNTALTETPIDDAETALFTAKVPGPYRLVLSPSAYGPVRQLARFTEEDKIGSGSAIVTGQLGTIKGFGVYRSQKVYKTGNNTYNLAFARDAIALVMRRLPQPLPGTGAIVEYAEMGGYGLRVVMSYQPNTLAQQFTIDALYGVGVLRNDHGVIVKS